MAAAIFDFGDDVSASIETVYQDGKTTVKIILNSVNDVVVIVMGKAQYQKLHNLMTQKGEIVDISSFFVPGFRP